MGYEVVKPSFSDKKFFKGAGNQNVPYVENNNISGDKRLSFVARDDLEYMSACLFVAHLGCGSFNVHYNTIDKKALNPDRQWMNDWANECMDSRYYHAPSLTMNHVSGNKAHFGCGVYSAGSRKIFEERASIWTSYGQQLRANGLSDWQIVLKAHEYIQSSDDAIKDKKQAKQACGSTGLKAERHIAAMGSYILDGAGIPSRGASNAKHAWVNAKIDGVWQSLDFTLDVSSSPSVLQDSGNYEVPRSRMSWYTDDGNEQFWRFRKALRYSVFSLMPDSPTMSINDIEVDAKGYFMPCIVYNKEIYVSPTELALIIGGHVVNQNGYEYIFVGDSVHAIPNSYILEYKGYKYMKAMALNVAGFKVSIEGKDTIIVQYAG